MTEAESDKGCRARRSCDLTVAQSAQRVSGAACAAEYVATWRMQAPRWMIASARGACAAYSDSNLNLNLNLNLNRDS